MSLTLSDNKKTITFGLPTLKGEIAVERLVQLEMPPIQKLLSLANYDDPRQLGDENVRTLHFLSNIHNHILCVADKFNASPGFSLSEWEDESLRVAFSLSAMFILYFNQYMLNSEEIWACQNAWMHLLRLRYHTISRLYERRDNEFLKKQSNWWENFAPAQRDWVNFCTNPDNHFLITGQQDTEREEDDRISQVLPMTDVEDEMIQIIRPSNHAPLYDFYLNDSRGQRRLERLIADWFLSARYDWGGGVRLVLERAGVWKWIISTSKWIWIILAYLVLACFALNALVIAPIPPTDYHWILQLSISFIYLLLVILGVWAFKRRPVMDVLLPRVWAATIVGYLPLFITDDLWRLASHSNWWGANWAGIFGLNAVASLLTFFYLKWEVNNHLARTPNLERSIPIIRAIGLTVWGWLVAVTVGLVLFHIAGTPMAASVWPHADKRPPLVSLPMLGGEIYPTLLFQFAPFALLVGVILQIFWEDKPITEPL